MTNEPNAALVGRVQSLIDKAKGDGLRHVLGLDTIEGDKATTATAANEIIALVQAARDEEIRDLLLSDGTITVMTDGVDRLREGCKYALVRAFRHIGLTGGTAESEGGDATD